MKLCKARYGFNMLAKLGLSRVEQKKEFTSDA